MIRNALLNETSWLALRAPDAEVGTGGTEPEGLPPGEAPEGEGGGDASEAPEPRRDRVGRQPAPAVRRTVKQELEASFEDARKAPADPRDRRGRFAPTGARRPGAEGGEAAPEVSEADAAAAAGEPEATGATSAAAVTAPAGWSREAKAEWAKVPPAAQAAVLKREADVQRGVDELKSRYAEIDGALQPHLEAIRRHGHTPAQAVNQLFAWFQALAQNPGQAFPALAQSFGHDLASFVSPAQAPAADAPGPQPGAGAAEIDPALRAYLDSVLQPLGGYLNQVDQRISQSERNYQAANEAKTQEVLSTWSRDKPHFDRVRQTMARLIASGEVPLANGRVDLDGAYNKAVWLDDEVRGEMLAKQEADKVAAAKAAREKQAAEAARKAEDARRASSSLAPSAPGTDPAAAARAQRKRGLSPRESILQAIEEHRAT